MPMFMCFYDSHTQANFLLRHIGKQDLHEAPPTDSSSSYCLHFFPSLYHPAPLSILLLHSFLGIPLLRCPWGFQLKTYICVSDGSFLSARKIHFRTATDFSCSRLNSSSFEIKSGQKVFNIDSHNKQQLFLWTALTHRVFILNLKPK